MTKISLKVNGQLRTVDADPDTPLAYVLRNQLRLTGTKIGCSKEQCGACAVLVAGEVTMSCVRAAVEFGDREIVTVEGLSDGVRLSDVQQAFRDEGAAQCGFCTPGLVIAVTGLLNRCPQPEKSDIQKSLYPHLCRCGSQPRVLAAIARLIEGR